MINQTIFKSYDVRGIYPSELDDQTAYLIGRAFVRYTSAYKVLTAFDARLSSLNLLKNIVDGMTTEDVQVCNIGRLPTECLYFALGFYDFDAGVMITASHNPKEYNGFKMIKKIGSTNALEMVRGKDLLAKAQAIDSKIKESAMSTTVIRISDIKENIALHKDVLPDYLNFVLSFADASVIKSFKIVIDASNGVMGKVIEGLKEKLPVEIIGLNFEPDGNFPNHSPNPLASGSSEQIRAKIKEEKADFGFMFDGDGDRVFLVNELGELVSADVTLLLLAKYLLEENPGASITYNAICSKATPEFIKKWGGMPIRTPVGFVNVREALIKNRGLIGGELSGHYCFKNFFYMDSGVLAFLILLQAVSRDGRKVSEIVKEFSPYFKAAEINFIVDDKEKIIEKVKKEYVSGKQDFLDGITVEHSDWWFNLRPSNTEPLLRLTIEANSPEMLELKKEELSNLINNLK